MGPYEKAQAIALAVMLVMAGAGWWWLLDPNPLPARHVRHEARPGHTGAAAVALAAALIVSRPTIRRDPLAPRVLERATAAGRHAATAPAATLAPFAFRAGHAYRIVVTKPFQATPTRHRAPERQRRAAPGTRRNGRKK